MANESQISWTGTIGADGTLSPGSTWGVVTGCERVSPGCDNCYAIRGAWRMGANPNEKIASKYRGLAVKAADGSLDWSGEVRCHRDRLVWPEQWQEPRKIFVCSQADLFHKDVPDDFLVEVFRVMARLPRHTYQVLTKRPGRLADTPVLRQKLAQVFLEETGQACWPGHIWFGISVETDAYRWRILKAKATGAPIIFISAEPLLAELHLAGYLDGVALVITGAESGPRSRRRPMQEDWVRRIERDTHAAHAAFWYKQKYEGNRKVELPLLDGVQYREFPHDDYEEDWSRPTDEVGYETCEEGGEGGGDERRRRYFHRACYGARQTAKEPEWPVERTKHITRAEAEGYICDWCAKPLSEVPLPTVRQATALPTLP